jgi:hypothetical protein
VKLVSAAAGSTAKTTHRITATEVILVKVIIKLHPQTSEIELSFSAVGFPLYCVSRATFVAAENLHGSHST